VRPSRKVIRPRKIVIPRARLGPSSRPRNLSLRSEATNRSPSPGKLSFRGAKRGIILPPPENCHSEERSEEESAFLGSRRTATPSPERSLQSNPSPQNRICHPERIIWFTKRISYGVERPLRSPRPKCVRGILSLVLCPSRTFVRNSCNTLPNPTLLTTFRLTSIPITAKIASLLAAPAEVILAAKSYRLRFLAANKSCNASSCGRNMRSNQDV